MAGQCLRLNEHYLFTLAFADQQSSVKLMVCNEMLQRILVAKFQNIADMAASRSCNSVAWAVDYFLFVMEEAKRQGCSE